MAGYDNYQFLPNYNKILFCDVWDDVDDFYSDMVDSPLYNSGITEAQYKQVFYFLFAKYGNNPIAVFDTFNFKLKVASLISAYAPTLFKKVEIQEAIRNLSLDDLQTGLRNMTNRALNDAGQPSNDTDTELSYINEQVVNKSKRSKLDAYGYLMSLLRYDPFEEFTNRFKTLFSRVVDTNETFIYMEEN